MFDLTMTQYHSRLPIGGLSYDSSTQCISSKLNTIYLRSKLKEVLLLLWDNRHRLISRDELISKIWGGNHLTGEKGVTHTICLLRKMFHQLGDNSLSIRTLPKQGYVLVVK